MSEVRTFSCDICGCQKQKANHWWIGFQLNEGGVIIHPWITTEEVFEQDSLGQGHVCDHPMVNSGKRFDFCGEGHALEWASKNLKRDEAAKKVSGL